MSWIALSSALAESRKAFDQANQEPEGMGRIQARRVGEIDARPAAIGDLVQIYAYRAHGRFDPERGLHFDPAKVLLDRYGRAVVVPDGYSRSTASRYGQTNAISIKSVVLDPMPTTGRVTRRCAGPLLRARSK
jgi:pullulanase/glycogen debranching enzyme